MNKEFNYDKWLYNGRYSHDLRKKERKLLKEKLEKQFNYKIPDYIVEDILDGEKYHHICIVINYAVESQDLTKEDGEILKRELKEIFCIENDYERVVKEIYIKQPFNFEEWHERYCNFEFIDLNKYLTEKDKDILKKLNINLKEKLYTEQEFEVMDMDLISYYKDEDEMEEEELEEILPLPENVIWEDYKKLVDKFNQIGKEYNLTGYR